MTIVLGICIAAVQPSATDEPDTHIIVFDGEIGAGKTTVIELVRQALVARGHTVTVVSEPVERWKDVGILQEFYAATDNRGGVTYEFQTYTFVTRISECIRCAESAPAKFFLCERSIWTDRHVFMELQRKLVGPMRMRMYEDWWGMWTQVMPFTPTKIVYLKPTISNCMARVAKRGRVGEVGGADKTADEQDVDACASGGVSTAYQLRLRRAHEAYLEGKHKQEFPQMPACPFNPDDIIVLDGSLVDDDFVNDARAAQRLVSQVLARACGI